MSPNVPEYRIIGLFYDVCGELGSMSVLKSLPIIIIVQLFSCEKGGKESPLTLRSLRTCFCVVGIVGWNVNCESAVALTCDVNENHCCLSKSKRLSALKLCLVECIELRVVKFRMVPTVDSYSRVYIFFRSYFIDLFRKAKPEICQWRVNPLLFCTLTDVKNVS